MNWELPEILLHFSIIFALSVPKLNAKRAFLLTLLAVLPDLDVLFYIHKSMSHSMIIILITFTPILLTIYRFKPKYLKLATLGLLAILSHLLLDSFQSYTPILYPILSSSIWFKIEGRVLMLRDSFIPEISATIKESPTVFKQFETIDAAFFTSQGLIIALMLVIPFIILRLKPIILNIKRVKPYWRFISNPIRTKRNKVRK